MPRDTERESQPEHDCQPEVPVILYACIHNSGRSVAAKVITEHLTKGAARVCSAGSEPSTSINPEIKAVLAEMGLSTDNEVPTLLSRDLVGEADVVVTMGCGETCPVFPGKRYLDWQVEDPAGQDRVSARRIVADIEIKVRSLLGELGLDVGEP